MPSTQLPGADERGARSSAPGAGAGLFSVENRTGLTDEEARDWGGWDRLESLVRGLASATSPTPMAAHPAAPRLAAGNRRRRGRRRRRRQSTGMRETITRARGSTHT